MKGDVTRILLAHRANIDRYAKLLKTDLTELERQYVHRRISEERSAIAKLEAQRFATTVASTAAATLIAAREATRRGQ